MDRQQQAARRVGVREVGEGPFVRAVPARVPSAAQLVPVRQGGLVAVVAIGDHHRALGEVGTDELDQARVVDPGELGGARRVGSARDRRGEGSVEAPGECVVPILVEQEQWRQVRACRAQHLQAIRFRSVHGLLVRSHDAPRVVLESQPREESLARATGSVRRLERLPQRVERRRFVLDQHAFATPAVQGLAQLGVVGVGLVRDVAGQLQSHGVVGVALVQHAAILGSDHVVGRRQHLRELDARRVVAQCGKGTDPGHVAISWRAVASSDSSMAPQRSTAGRGPQSRAKPRPTRPVRPSRRRTRRV